MPIAVHPLTSGASSVDGPSHATASITPTAGRPVFAFVGRRSAAAGDMGISLSGNGLTWVQCGASTSGGTELLVFRAKGGAPSAGAVTISYLNRDAVSAGWSFFELSGANAELANAEGAVVQAVDNNGSGTSGLVTLAPFEDALNAVIAGFFHFANEASTPDPDFTEIHDVNVASGDLGLMTEYRIANDTGPTASWATSTGWRGVALEIRDASVRLFIPQVMVT